MPDCVIPAIGPRIPPVFVKTTAPAKLFKTLPPYGAPAVLVFLRNWIITAFCKWITAKNPLTCQNHTFYSAVLFKCLDGVLRARRRVLAVRSCHRGNIELISPNHLYQDLLNQYSHFDSPECYAVRISAGMHSQFF